jgi:hypothetical protein
MNEERYAKGDNVFVYPNQHLPYFRDVADIFEQEGLDYEDSDVLFVGGTMYAHDFKAEYPEAEVDVLERNPLTAYLQTFLSHQFEQGFSSEEIKNQVFHYESKKEDDIPLSERSTWGGGGATLEELRITNSDLEQNIQRHRAFSNTGWWNHNYEIPNRLLNHVEFYSEDTEEKRESLISLRETNGYAHLIENFPESGDEFLTINSGRMDSNNWEGVLEDVENFAPVDKIRIEDVKESEGDYDAIFFNNVFDYIDLERTSGIIDSLAGENGAYVEATLLGWSVLNEGRISFDNRMPENIELLEYAPEADFYWERWPEDQKGVKKSPNKVRLYQPTEK